MKPVGDPERQISRENNIFSHLKVYCRQKCPQLMCQEQNFIELLLRVVCMFSVMAADLLSLFSAFKGDMSNPFSFF